MKTQLSHLLIAAIVAFVLAETGPLLANGGAFFVPASKGPVELVYFARIKDARTSSSFGVSWAPAAAGKSNTRACSSTRWTSQECLGR